MFFTELLLAFALALLLTALFSLAFRRTGPLSVNAILKRSILLMKEHRKRFGKNKKNAQND